MVKSKDISNMAYVEFMALLSETNRPPGGKDSVRQLVLNSFLNKESEVLDVGCNTGYCSFEIAHLAKCKITGIDFSKEMIDEANKNLDLEEEFGSNINFEIGDGQKTNFKDNTFDLVMSGGSTVFIPDKKKAFQEYERICKDWGFIGDIIFYYREKPPKELLEKMNNILGFEIEAWDKKYWLDFYKETGLEFYYEYNNRMQYNNREKVKDYVRYMSTKNKDWSKDFQDEVYKKLLPIMEVFNENHKYLDYGVFIFRKRPQEEELSLFGA